MMMGTCHLHVLLYLFLLSCCILFLAREVSGFVISQPEKCNNKTWTRSRRRQSSTSSLSFSSLWTKEGTVIGRQRVGGGGGLFQSSESSSASHEQQQQGEQQQQQRPIQPVFVLDETAATAARLALYTLQVLTGRIRIPPPPPPPPPPPVNNDDEMDMEAEAVSTTTPTTLFPIPVYTVNSSDQLQEALDQQVQMQNSSSPILHLPIPIDARTGTVIGTSIFTPEILNQVSFVGLHILKCNDAAGDRGGGGDDDDDQSDNNVPLLEEVAQSAGTILNQVLGSCPPPPRSPTSGSSIPTSFVSLDLELHLAMLKTNSLPKQQQHPLPPFPHLDSYHVLLPEGGSLLIDYYFDFTNPFNGGSDPLSCPTKEILIECPPTQSSIRRSQHLSAAYTTLCGQGIQLPISAAIAASTATMLGDGPATDTDTATAITWEIIQDTVQLSEHIRQAGTWEQPPGFMRNKYKEFGYK